ncbi:Trypsin domain protein [Gloeomargarita lithophora Alchichica-D10]|uniref:Trypsin domain protein n=1 Tax=Gloeomargarita lithophora Alchichica-D10 TaxID=1188229 RepID=A0A1J0AAM2_9CYAN|nr:serine protease [Gloeomargarita lithophora]APB32979.1 Trypsin domain protein [Gloeomargarita lithophora Alchichica-D10]
MKPRIIWPWVLGLGLLVGFGLWEWQKARPARQGLPQLSEPLLTRLAHSITVKVLVGQNWGSGVLVARQGQTYTLVTNQHVLEGDSRTTAYQIRTPDGRLHPAKSLPLGHPNGDDVAALEFTSDRNYPLACAQPHLPPVGAAVFAAGFPFPTEGQTDLGLVFTTGQVGLILPKSLEGGYRLGYTNNVEKGMSGGPVLNGYGRLVALNGVHKNPLWGDPYRYASGGTPAPELRAQLADYSWGIPMTQVWQGLKVTAPPCEPAASPGSKVTQDIILSPPRSR